MFGFSAAALAVTGIGLSAASAAGAFNGKVDNWMPTPEEMEAAKWSKKTFGLSQELQQPLDRMVREDLKYLQSPEAMERAAGENVNNFFANTNMAAPIQSAAATSGGPGSGRWWDSLYDTKAGVTRGLYDANVSGRLTGLNNSISATNQFLGRRSQDLGTGLGAMTSGGQQSAQAQADRISGQIARNVATSSAMSGLGNTMIGAGMGLAGKVKT